MLAPKPLRTGVKSHVRDQLELDQGIKAADGPEVTTGRNSSQERRGTSWGL